MNTYGYANQNPVRFIDPTGEVAQVLALCGASPANAAACATAIAATAQVVTQSCKVASDAIGDFLGPYFNEEDDSGRQDKKLTPGEIKKLKDRKVHPHGLKDNSRQDLFKDRDGNIIVKPKNGTGPGDPTGLNINDF